MFGRSPYQSSSCIVRLNCERLEAREVPAVYFVKLHSLTTGDPFLSFPEATVSGFLDLNASHPSVTNGGIAVDAASATDAVRHGLFGRIGVRSQANGQPLALFHDYRPAIVSANPAAQMPFLVQTAGVPYMSTMYKVSLEDLATTNLANWDYNDRVWLVEADDGTSLPPPPNTVGASPPYVPDLTVEFLDKNLQGKTDGKVAKWQNAYEVTDKVRVKNNYPATDDDRYVIQVKDPWFKNTTTPTYQPVPQPIRVISDSDFGNGLTLHRITDEMGGFYGEYRSDPFVLVSNEVDDLFIVNGKPDNALDDTTFMVQLGDTLTISYDANPAGQTSRPIVHKRVPIRVLKEVKVHINVMTVADGNGSKPAVATQAEVDEWMAEANQTFAQVGVRLVWGAVQFADEPTATQPGDDDVILSDGLSDPTTQKKEARGLLRGTRIVGGVPTPLRTPENDDVELFFINHFSVPDEVPDGMGGTNTVYIEDSAFRGQSFPAYHYGNEPGEADLVDSVIVSAKNRDVFTVAHEIGHILTDAGHVQEGPGGLGRALVESNLMRSGDHEMSEQLDEIVPPGPGDPRYQDWLTATKRLNDNQQWAIWTKRLEIVKDYIP